MSFILTAGRDERGAASTLAAGVVDEIASLNFRGRKRAKPEAVERLTEN